MTKVNDLVTVTADKLFTLFPVDDERYELVYHISECLREGIAIFLGVASTDDRDIRIRTALSDSRQDLILAAHAWKGSVVYGELPGRHAKSMRSALYRALSISEFDYLSNSILDEDWLSKLSELFWSKVLVRIMHQSNFQLQMSLIRTGGIP